MLVSVTKFAVTQETTRVHRYREPMVDTPSTHVLLRWKGFSLRLPRCLEKS